MGQNVLLKGSMKNIILAYIKYDSHADFAD